METMSVSHSISCVDVTRQCERERQQISKYFLKLSVMFSSCQEKVLLSREAIEKGNLEG